MPERDGVIRDHDRFFRAGVSGARFVELTTAELGDYEARMAALAPPDLLRWLHR